MFPARRVSWFALASKRGTGGIESWQSGVIRHPLRIDLSHAFSTVPSVPTVPCRAVSTLFGGTLRFFQNVPTVPLSQREGRPLARIWDSFVCGTVLFLRTVPLKTVGTYGNGTVGTVGTVFWDMVQVGFSQGGGKMMRMATSTA